MYRNSWRCRPNSWANTFSRLIKIAVGMLATNPPSTRRRNAPAQQISSMRWRIRINNSTVERLPFLAFYLPWRNGEPKMGTCKNGEPAVTHWWWDEDEDDDDDDNGGGARESSDSANESNHVRTNSQQNPITHSHWPRCARAILSVDGFVRH